MHVLVLHQHYWPEIAATAQILTDLCEDLATFGHEVTVVCGQPSYRAMGGASRLLKREEHRGVKIERVWSHAPRKRGIPQRLVHYTSYFGSSLTAALKAKRPDVCLVMSTPPLLLGVSGALLRALRGIPFVYSVQDLYPDIAIHLGVIKERSPVTQTVNFVASHCYRRAAALVTLSPGMGKRLVKKGLPADRVHVIPNWADTSSLEPVARDNPFAREHGLAAGFVVQYSGNIGQSQGLEQVVAAAVALRELPITFLFAGDGNARPRLELLAREYALETVRFLPPQPRERLSELLSACDVGLVPMKRGVGDDLVPSKLYGIMAAARPVLASVEPHSEVARVVSAHDCGFIAPSENSDALAQSIRRAFMASEHERNRLGRNGRLACTEHYSRVALTRRYEQVLRHAMGDYSAAAGRSGRVRSPRHGQAPPAEGTWPISR
jgi:colanic acid biosynthesis glycosyl transferase WcaI